MAPASGAKISPFSSHGANRSKGRRISRSGSQLRLVSRAIAPRVWMRPKPQRSVFVYDIDRICEGIDWVDGIAGNEAVGACQVLNRRSEDVTIDGSIVYDDGWRAPLQAIDRFRESGKPIPGYFGHIKIRANESRVIVFRLLAIKWELLNCKADEARPIHDGPSVLLTRIPVTLSMGNARAELERDQMQILENISFRLQISCKCGNEKGSVSIPLSIIAGSVTLGSPRQIPHRGFPPPPGVIPEF